MNSGRKSCVSQTFKIKIKKLNIYEYTYKFEKNEIIFFSYPEEILTLSEHIMSHSDPYIDFG